MAATSETFSVASAFLRSARTALCRRIQTASKSREFRDLVSAEANGGKPAPSRVSFHCAARDLMRSWAGMNAPRPPPRATSANPSTFSSDNETGKPFSPDDFVFGYAFDQGSSTLRVIAANRIEVRGLLSKDRTDRKFPGERQRDHLAVRSASLFSGRPRRGSLASLPRPDLLDPLNFGLSLIFRENVLGVVANQRLVELNLLLGASFERAVGALEVFAGTLVHLDEAVRLLLLSAFKDDIGRFERDKPSDRALHALENALKKVNTFDLLAVNEVLPFQIE